MKQYVPIIVLLSINIICMDTVNLKSSAIIPKQTIQSVIIDSLSFSYYMDENSSVISSGEETDADDLPILIGEALSYPNPMSFKKEDGIIGYRLSRDSNITITVYSMTGQKIYSRDILAGDSGARENYNTIPFNSSLLGGEILPTGVYPFLVFSEGTLLSEGRIGVIP